MTSVGASRCLRLMLVVAVAFPCTVTTVWGARMQPFFDPNCFARNCSWSWESPVPGVVDTQYCDRTVIDNANICPNPFGRPDVEDRPAPANDVHVSDMHRVFTSLEPGANGQYTCLNITYTINQFVADEVIGLQLSVRGNEMPDLGRLYCLNMNFSSHGLQSYAVQDVVFANQCFCGIKPGREYEVTVRTMPVDDNVNDPYDSKVEKRYRPDGCEVMSKQNDVRCQKSVEARWMPECIVVDQQTQIGNYDIVVVSFDVAPANYAFDRYKVFIYHQYPDNRLSLVDYMDVDMKQVTTESRTCPTSLGLHETLVLKFNTTKNYRGTKWIDNFEGAMFFVRVQPKPADNKCLDAEEVQTACKIADSRQFSVISDPCTGNPCSQGVGDVVGTCISNEELYSCSCIPGYRFWVNTCIADPCKLLASNGSWIAQCTNGTCAYTPDQSDFYCNCNEGYDYLKEPKLCDANPCARNLETNVTVCGRHGECIKNLTDEQVTYRCRCEEGYSVTEHKEGCEATGPYFGLIVGVVTGSCLAGLLLFFIVLCFFRHRNNLSITSRKKDTQPPVDKGIPKPVKSRQSELVRRSRQSELVSRSRRVLPIYSDDHPLHREVVQCFCRLLQRHCMCDVSLMDWHKSIGPSVEMWLSAEIDKADIVLLLCSKGTGLKYGEKAQLKTPSGSLGVYGDVYVKALTLLDDYFLQNNANEKFVAAFFDYSKEADIPVTFRRFGKYRLMQHMESLFLRIHDTVRDSPHSSRRVVQVQESQYPLLEMGQPLQQAIEAMKALVKSDPKWYERHNSGQPSETSSPSLPHQPPLNSLNPQVSMDSAYDSSEMPRAPEGFFKDSSSDRSSIGSNFEESLHQFLSFSTPGHAQPLPYDQPHTRLFSKDIHLNMSGDVGDPFQSGPFFSDVQMGDQAKTQGRAGSFA